MMVGSLLSFWDGIFSGAMLNFQGVTFHPRLHRKNFHRPWIGGFATTRKTRVAKCWKKMGPAEIGTAAYVRSGLNSLYFHIIGDGHQPNSRGLYTHYKDSLLKVG